MNRYTYQPDNKYHSCIGFYDIDGVTTPVYFEKNSGKYKYMKTSMKTFKDKQTKEMMTVFNGIEWIYINIEELNKPC